MLSIQKLFREIKDNTRKLNGANTSRLYNIPLLIIGHRSQMRIDLQLRVNVICWGWCMLAHWLQWNCRKSSRYNFLILRTIK